MLIIHAWREVAAPEQERMFFGDPFTQRPLPGVVDNAGTATIRTLSAEDRVWPGWPMFSLGGRNCKGTQTAGSQFVGVAVSDSTTPPDPNPYDPSTGGYPAWESVPIMTRGTVWVVAGSDGAKLDRVYVTPTSRFTSIAPGNLAINARFVDEPATGRTVRIEMY